MLGIFRNPFKWFNRKEKTVNVSRKEIKYPMDLPKPKKGRPLGSKNKVARRTKKDIELN